MSGEKVAEKMVLLGNEAIAWGAVAGGVRVACGYPGTPSSEVMETLLRLAPRFGFYAEWSVNEKVALETAAGAAFAGARAVVTMKQVGLNVAADALMTLAYLGVKGGLVLVVADDPGPHSSQNEQDTRLFARMAKVPVLDPATPQEAYDMMPWAFALSERLRLPVILRPVTRVCHSCQEVRVAAEVAKEGAAGPIPGFERSPEWVILPGPAYRKHLALEEKQEEARRLLEEAPFNAVFPGRKGTGEGRRGIIACGECYPYVREALAILEEETGFEAASLPLLKLATPYPLPEGLVLDFLQGLDQVLVVEELETVVEEAVVALAFRQRLPLRVRGRSDALLPKAGEFDVDLLLRALAGYLNLEVPLAGEIPPPPPLPNRPPTLCAGCPHRASFYAVKRAARKRAAQGEEVFFPGDIGCYTLGVMPPLGTTDTCLCMGAGLSIAAGLYRAEPHRRQVAFIGDSTFFHAGLPALANLVYNRARVVVAVLDNRTTAMTGHQPHPGLPRTGLGEPTFPQSIETIAGAMGVGYVRVVDPFHLSEAVKVVEEALAQEGPAVVVFRSPCVAILGRGQGEKVRYRVSEACHGCQTCLRELGCPALLPTAAGRVEIGAKCTGCGLCAQVCPRKAITTVSPAEGAADDTTLIKPQ